MDFIRVSCIAALPVMGCFVGSITEEDEGPVLKGEIPRQSKQNSPGHRTLNP